MNYYLREVTGNDGKEIFDMIKEIGPGENGFGNSGWDMREDEFEEYLKKNVEMGKGIGLKPNYLPQNTYWFYANDRPVGIINFRPEMNESLRKHGGNIGYSIRPSERGKGYGTKMLKEILKITKGYGLDKILLTVAEDNIPSRRVVENNSGEFYDILDGRCRYWINI